MKKALVVVGTRPEAIKLAPVVIALRQTGAIQPIVCLTGQHTDLVHDVLRAFDIVPTYDLEGHRANRSLTELSSLIYKKLPKVIAAERAEWLLVQGDTTTVAASAIVGAYSGCIVGHVEAGLRTKDKRNPFPEEINRRLAAVAADVHFAPTEGARDNLLREGIPGQTIHVCGNTGIDALRLAMMIHPRNLMQRYGLSLSKKTITVTAHRRESIGTPLGEICEALIAVAERYAESVQLAVQVHPNPAIKDTLTAKLRAKPGISLLDPMPYLDFVHLLSNSVAIITDSGGIQEEAPWLGVPVIVVRELTERPEGVLAGIAELVGTNKARILDAVTRVLVPTGTQQAIRALAKLYGDGYAAQRIATVIHNA